MPRLISRASTRDPVMWAAVAWVVVGILISLGTLYLTGGIHVPPGDPAFTVIRVLPGREHTHGAIMATLAVTLGAGLIVAMFRDQTRTPRLAAFLRFTLLAVCGWSCWTVYAFASAARLTGGVVWWLAAVALSVLLIVRPPRDDREDRRDS